MEHSFKFWHLNQKTSKNYFLESKFNWTGVALEILPDRVIEFNANKKPLRTGICKAI